MVLHLFTRSLFKYTLIFKHNSKLVTKCLWNFESVHIIQNGII